MGRKTYVVGVGMTKFEKPQSKDWDYPDMAKESISKALDDAKIPYDAIEQACVGYVYGESTCGQRAIYQFGLTGIPVYNVNNNCSTGSTALFMARQLVEGGIADCVLALGFEKMQKGSLGLDVQRPHEPDGQAHHGDDREARVHRRASGAVDVRQRRTRSHGAIRHQRGPLRVDRLEEPQALGRTTRTRSSRRSTRSRTSRTRR